MDLEHAFVCVVDADAGFRAKISRVSERLALRAMSFCRMGEFLSQATVPRIDCLIVEFSALDGDAPFSLTRLQEMGCDAPLILTATESDIQDCARAMKNGASDLLVKPIDEMTMQKAIWSAVESHRRLAPSRAGQRDLSHRLASLTFREREVLPLLMAGLLNKEIAAQLGVVEKTVKVHRKKIMEKLKVRGVVELVYRVLFSSFQPLACPKLRRLVEEASAVLNGGLAQSPIDTN